jgi:hypothetical protein
MTWTPCTRSDQRRRGGYRLADRRFDALGLDQVIRRGPPGQRPLTPRCERLGMREAGVRPAYGADHVAYVTRTGHAMPRPCSKR